MRGDVLASGGARAQFQGPNVSQEKWDAIWADSSGSDASIEKAGNGGSGVTADKSDAGKS